jgi:hypothetical protein
MLTGQQLLALVKANPDMTRTELAKEAGYVRTTDDGKEQVLLQQFYDACFEAHGTPIKSGRGLKGKSAQYETTVHQSGILLIGKTYTKEFGADFGDTFGIEVREDGIWLPLKERDPNPVKVAKPRKKKAKASAETTEAEETEACEMAVAA